MTTSQAKAFLAGYYHKRILLRGREIGYTDYIPRIGDLIDSLACCNQPPFQVMYDPSKS